LMWNGAGNNDVYRLTLTEKYYSYTEYFKGTGQHIIDDPTWQNVARSGSGPTSDPLKVELNRYTGSIAYKQQSLTVHVAQGRLRGTVYYWELPDACSAGDGRIVRIKPGVAQVEEFYKPGICFGCHSVSRDGRSMMAAFQSTVPQTQKTIDLTGKPLAKDGPINQSTGLQGTFSAWNDTGDKILIGTDTGDNTTSYLRIVDSSNGKVLNPNALSNGCGDPAWSPDGKKIAGVCNLNPGTWIHNTATSGDLVIGDVNGSTVSNKKTIVPMGNVVGRPAYPSFSPTSDWIAYGRPSNAGTSTGAGDLWLVDIGGKTPKKLVSASGGTNAFNPVFAPLRAGGYSWIAFISRRDYGNRLVGANRQQVWVTAVDDPPTALDPSHPPFYLRGQEDCGKSENAYFALEPCKNKGESCTSGVDCCGGQCVKDPKTQAYTCGDPSNCSNVDNACKQPSDCCDPGAQCLDGFCQFPPPK
jgi:WD40-like Beta Propeller Repeat